MQHIDKNAEPYRTQALAFLDKTINGCWQDGRYVNLEYKNVRKQSLTSILVESQSGRCCYCMRRLHLGTEGSQHHNVTLEHIIPNKIKQPQWQAEQLFYQKYNELSDNNLTICFGGRLADPTIRLPLPPYPHFLAYDNLVASCDGQTLNEGGKEIQKHCCNEYRGNKYVPPLYYHPNVISEITYDHCGHIVCEEEIVPFIGTDGININSTFLTKVRRFWSMLACSQEYSVHDIHNAEMDDKLRQNIIDDIFYADTEGQWNILFCENVWRIFADYDWFYQYYAAHIIIAKQSNQKKK